MDSLTLNLFKIVQFAVIVAFTYFISDLRKKNRSSLLINKKFLLTLKLSYAFPIIIYSYVILALVSVSYFDVLALVTTSIGTAIAAIAKLTLSSKHTWAGYCFASTECFVSKGIYAYIRHPLYTGIYVFIFGGALTFIPNLHWAPTLLVGLLLSYVMVFLAIIASRETAYFTRKFGLPYKEYVMQVHPFLPFKKFHQS